MPHAGIVSLAVGELTIKKKKGKELSSAQGKELSPESLMARNNAVKSKKGVGR